MSAVAPSRRGVVAGGLALLAAGRSHAAGQAGVPGVVRPGTPLAQIYDGGRWCEGPAWDRRSGALVFSDVRSNRLMRLAPGERAAAIRDPSDFSNGNAFDHQGRLLTCEHLTRRLVRQEADGRLTVLADRYDGQRLNSPNDLAVAADGAVWFTDPTFGLMQPEEGREAEPEQRGRYVFRLDPGGALSVVADEFEQPNGIVFSPDGRTLYVSDTSAAEGREGKREVRAFDVVDGRRLARGRLFATVDAGVPDGLAADADGRVYAATDRGATVWDRAGALLGHVATPAPCANLAFGGRDGRRLFLLGGTSIYAVDTEARGAEWA